LIAGAADLIDLRPPFFPGLRHYRSYRYYRHHRQDQ